MNPLVHDFWTATKLPSVDYRDRAIKQDPKRRGDQCEIPTVHIAGLELGLSAAEQERGTIFCADRCPDYPEGCKVAATPERLAAFRAAVDEIRAANAKVDAEIARRLAYQERVREEMRISRSERAAISERTVE